MRTSPTALALALVFATVGAAGVRAADMPEYPPIIEAPEPLPFASAGGWYLRGDIGYKWYNEPSAGLTNPNYAGFAADPNGAQMWNEEMGDAWNVGIGAGYKFNDYLRADLTFDYESAGEFSGRLWCDAPCAATDYSAEYMDIEAWSALANVYADLGTYGGFTPYVGGGLGFSYLVASNGSSDAPGVAFDGPVNGEETWNFAWALMAGASYALNEQLSVDVGYRYLDLGEARSGRITNGVSSTRIKYDDITAHEVRVGLRYNLF
jgi:opacity protein-like surface antigen